MTVTAATPGLPPDANTAELVVLKGHTAWVALALALALAVAPAGVIFAR